MIIPKQTAAVTRVIGRESSVATRESRIKPAGDCSITCPDGSFTSKLCTDPNHNCECYCDPGYGAVCDQCR